MRKALKYLLYFILLVVLILLLITYLLHTESGSRFAIKQGIGFAELDLTYDSINGNISDGLIIKNMRYQDQTIDIDIKNIKFESNWSWLSRHLELTNVIIDGVIVTPQTPSESSLESQPFTGVELPLTIDIKQLLVKQLTLASGTELIAIDVIELSALFEPKEAKIKNLTVQVTDYGLSASGSLNYAAGLSYTIDADWYVQLEGQLVESNGSIEGNLSFIKLNQTLQVKTNQLEGLFNLQGEVTGLQQVPVFDLDLTASNTQLVLEQKTLEFKGLKAKLSGLIDDYSISLQSELSQQQLNDVVIPASQIKIQASGNSQQLTTQVAQIITPEGIIDLQATVNWQDQLQLTSQLELSNFNPQQLLQDWPGIINGQIELNLDMSEQGMVINSQNNTLKGQLKGQPFALSGSASYTTDTLSAEQLRIDLGDNFVLINGQYNEQSKGQSVSLTVAVNWIDLSILEPKLTGSIEGSVKLAGDYLNPQIEVDLAGQQLTFAEHQVSALTLKSNGKWNKNLSTTITAENASLGGQEFKTIQIQQNGWLDSHEIEIALMNNELRSTLQLKGRFNNSMPANKALSWQGQITSHELTLDSDKKIQLQAPVAIEVAEHISIEAGCWQGVEAGTLCIELNDIKQADNNYQGSLILDDFSLIPLQVFLPDDIEVKGKLQGAVKFLYQADELNVESNLKLHGGEIGVRNEQGVIYQSVIDRLEINTKTTNQDIDISINTELADKSFLNLQIRLENPNNQNWQINSNFEGVFFSTELIKELTAEIKDLQGQISIDGSIDGPLTKPNINLSLSQADGYLTLTRLGTVIENLKLSINTEGINQPVYDIKLSGNNLVSIHQGQIESSGELSFPANKQWLYQGTITGDDFMLLNLPEAKFNISPDLTILANHQSTDISGDLVIDSGHVIVKQLPASSVSNSADLKIHTSEATDATAYPVSMNIRASIKDPIELDVIGLVAGLTGSVQLTQSKEQPLAAKGLLNLTDGSYKIYGQKLDINEGELSFTGPLDNPRLKVKASRKSISGDVLAGVELGGAVNNLQSKLYSEPSLSDIEKLSYIMTGRGIDNSGSLDGESLKQAAIVMGLNQSSPVFNQIQSQFGIDVLTVRESTVAVDTVVEAGKKINDKLYISYNQGLFNRLGFWMIKYRINSFLNLETTQGVDQSIELVYTRKAEIKKNKNIADNND